LLKKNISCPPFIFHKKIRRRHLRERKYISGRKWQVENFFLTEILRLMRFVARQVRKKPFVVSISRNFFPEKQFFSRCFVEVGPTDFSLPLPGQPK